MLANYLSDLISGKRQITATKLLFLLSLFFVAIYNIAFFRHILAVYPLSPKNFYFLISLTAGITFVIFLLFTLITSAGGTKPILIFFLITSSVAAYFMDSYDVVIDHIMMQNIAETDWSETYDLLNIKILYYLLLLGLLPSWFVYRVRITAESLKKSIFRKIRDSFVAVLLIFAIILTFSRFYTSFFREHKPLRYYSNPGYYVYSFGKYISQNFNLHKKTVSPLGLDAEATEPTHDEQQKELVILVVGEAARADHFSLNGYPKETNPLLKKEDIISMSRVFSCGTSTAYSVPCMFSVFPRAEFSHSRGKANENVLDVLHHTGFVDILWRDNNSDSKGVALRVAYEDYSLPENNTLCSDGECRDEGMLVGLDQYIAEHQGRDILIILHQMGNHGPAYYKRYPKAFEQFTPACTTNQLEECTQEEIINAYDNALLYTDYFLSKVIDLLKKYDKNHETAMIYFSDHGESLGESGVYLHGLPYMIAPESQKHIGALMWFGDHFTKDIDVDSIQKKRDREYSHDNLFHTLLGLFEIKTEVYNRELDILHD
ncbi:MAG: phosphoethanolamine transferase [Candidatus Electrothrix sp. YB6]